MLLTRKLPGRKPAAFSLGRASGGRPLIGVW
jgi:hypothetical protein